MKSKSKKEWIQDLQVNKRSVQLKLDTGAGCNVISKKSLKKMNPKPKIKKTNARLSAYNNSPIPVCGRTILRVTHNGVQHNVMFIVVDADLDPILGLSTIEHLELIKRVEEIKNQHIVKQQIDFRRELDMFCNEIKEEVSSIKTYEMNGEEITEKYASCFQTCDKDGQFGTLPRIHDMKIREEVRPSIVPPRKIAHALKAKVKRKLDEMVASGIISPVEEPTEWVSGMVVVEKTNGDVRICIDPKNLNKAIKRQHHKMPTTEELLAEMAGAKYFTKLDASSGYWQIKVTDESSDLLTFATPWGRFKFLRLPFGIHSASEVFQVEVANIIAGLSGCLNMQDDIIIWGKTREEHDQNLDAVMKQILKSGLKLNIEKCEYGVQELKFLGHILSADGIRPDPEKTRAITEMKLPRNVTELQRFLGMMNYLGKFIPNLAEITAPLRLLLKKENEFVLQQPQIEAINKLKTLVTSSPILKFYDPNLPIRIRTDSSLDGVGAVLEQLHGNKFFPVAYASRSCINAEKRYASIEREAMSVLFGCSRFHEYVYGRVFTVLNDHKPLQTIFKKHITCCPPRIQRFLFQLQKYNFVLEYSPGKTMVVSDTLSRAPVQDAQTEIEPAEIIFHVNSIIQNLPISRARYEQFKSATSEDESLKKVIEFCQNGWPADASGIEQEIKPYYPIRDELSYTNGLVLKSSRIVVPKSLRSEMKTLIHQGHQGIEKCRKRARKTLYWPRMNHEIDELVSGCEQCITHRNRLQQEALIPHDVPNSPWVKVGSDLFKLKGLEYLLVVDYYSKYVEIAPLRNPVDAANVISNMKKMFSRHGIPKEIFSDGGPQYKAASFKKFCRDWDIEHNRSSPHYPQSNGQAERFVQTVKNTLLKACEGQDDPYLALLAINTTPGVDGRSPAEKMFNRAVRTLIPSLQTSVPQQVSEMERSIATSSQGGDKEESSISPGSAVRIRYDTDKSWEKRGIVVARREEPRSYDVLNAKGNILRVNQRHLLPCKDNELPPADETSRETIAIETEVTPNNTDDSNVKVEVQEDPQQFMNTPQRTNTEERCTRTRSGRTVRLPIRYR